MAPKMPFSLPFDGLTWFLWIFFFFFGGRPWGGAAIGWPVCSGQHRADHHIGRLPGREVRTCSHQTAFPLPCTPRRCLRCPAWVGASLLSPKAGSWAKRGWDGVKREHGMGGGWVERSCHSSLEDDNLPVDDSNSIRMPALRCSRCVTMAKVPCYSESCVSHGGGSDAHLVGSSRRLTELTRALVSARRGFRCY